MSEQVSVCEYAPVDQSKSKWLNNILLPLVEACRFERKIEVTISPLHTGTFKCRGMSPRHHFRGSKPFIYLSVQYPFWRKAEIAYVYLHECAHKLIDISEIKRKKYSRESHGPIFLLVEMVLFKRADQASNLEHKLFSKIDFYDFADKPHLTDEASEHEYIFEQAVLVNLSLDACGQVKRLPGFEALDVFEHVPRIRLDGRLAQPCQPRHFAAVLALEKFVQALTVGR